MKYTTQCLRNPSGHIDSLALESMLHSMDVNSHYTNIPHADVVDACQSHLTKPNIQSDIETNIPILIDFILKTIHLLLMMLQANATAMDTKMAPAYANIFTESVENSFLSYFSLSPTVYYTYINDIFML